MTAINSTTWPTKYPQERVTAEFDFGPDLPPGDSIATIQLFLSTVQGVDATPDNLRYGASVIKGARVFQQFHSGLANCSYQVACHATTANNNLFILVRVLPVVPYLT